jgi:hypothetical protein
MDYRYQNINVTKQPSTGERYYVNNVYPDIPLSGEDSYVITVLGDRLDLLAFDFYGDTSFWWVIASANALPGDSLYLEPGAQIRIPANLSGVINDYKIVNVTR